MIDLKNEYNSEINKIEMPKEVLHRTKNAMHDQEKGISPKKEYKHKIKWATLIPACVLVLGMTVSVSAAVYATYKAVQPVAQPHITLSTPASVMEPGGGQDAQSGLDIQITGTAADKDTLYINFVVKTDDGSPIAQTAENQYTGPLQSFSKAVLTVDGQTYTVDVNDQKNSSGWITRNDDGSQPDTASFEITYWGDFSEMQGKDATLTLTNFTQQLETCEDIGFLFSNIGEAYAQLTPEEPENFIETGVYAEYADGSTVPSYTIPAGDAHIEFSSEFPGAYIDNMGFHKTGEKGVETDMLYISIVPANTTQAKELEALGFQQLDTRALQESASYLGSGASYGGWDNEENRERQKSDQTAKIAQNEGRVVLLLNAMLPDHRDLTVADLDNYRIVGNIQYKETTRSAGTWQLPLTVSSNETLTYQPMQTLQLVNGGSLTIENIALSPLRLQVSGGENNANIKSPFSAATKIILDDGTRYIADRKGAAGGWGNGSFEFEWNLDQLVEPQRVVAIEIDGQRVELKATS